ncbi:pentapeptide repeat-containing protein [Desulfobacterales bacterium HSG2]|nr:pentapeptide repeat-containing protein [Desulfobacterales bacterium HSG2]
MANEEHFRILKQGVEAWNEWRERNPNVKPDLREAFLSEAFLKEVFFRETNLINASLREANLRGANLRGANLRGANLRGANLRGTISSSADLSGADLSGANFSSADLRGADLSEINFSRAYLRRTDFRGANLTGANLSGAYLCKTDLRNANLIKAVLNKADITKACLYGTVRYDWEVEGIKCDYIYWDEKGKERYPENRNFEPNEFEKLYKNLADLTKFKDLITRSIEFPPEYYQAGISILNEFGSVLQKKHPDTKAKIRIEQDGLKVTMTIDPVEGDREVIENELDEYGLVITGRMTPEEYADNDPLLLVELKSQLNIAMVQLENQKLIAEYQDREIKKQDIQIDKLLSLVGQGIQSQPDITFSPTVNIKQREEKRMGNDTISISAKGDVAFAKDEAIATINKAITEAAKITNSLEDKLNELSAAVENMVRDMPDEKAKEVTGDLQTLVSEASKDQPRRK